MEHRAVRKLKNPGKVKLRRMKDEKIRWLIKDTNEEPESCEDWSKYIMNVDRRVSEIWKGGHNRKTKW